MSFMEKLFGNFSDKELKRIKPIANKVLELEPEMQKLTDEELQAKTPYLKEKLKNGASLDDILPEAFAVCREADWRVLGLKPYPVQIIGGIVLHRSCIAEMQTGEGKTLVATLPAYLNALTGEGVHIVTVNDYLAKRDSEWMGKVYRFMGLTVGLGLVLCVLLRLFQTQLLGIYIKPTDDAYEAVMAAGVVRVLAISQFQWVGGMMETACGSIRGLGKTINPTVTTLIGACGLRIVWLYTIFKAVGTIESLYWSYPVSWVLTLAIHIVFLLIYKRQLEAPQKGENACASSV